MRIKYLMPIVGALCCTFISCSKDENDNKKASGTISFSFNSIVNPTKNELGQKSKDSTTLVPTAIVISITDNSGNIITQMEEIPLYNMNGNFISKPITLEQGSYKLSDFLVIDNYGNVLYLTPKEGSPMAYLVTTPLPVDFSVSKDQVTNVNVEVLENTGENPEEFGYSTFTFNVVDIFKFYVGVFTYSDSSHTYELTNSEIEIYKDSSKIYSGELLPITTSISLREEDGSYTIVIKKDGYEDFTKSLTLSELMEYTASNPLIVMLSKEEFSIPTDGLVAYYPFNGNANDESGNAHNGTVYGASLTTDRHHKANSAYEFDGINDYINTFSTFDYNYRTISFWAYLSDITTLQVLICQDSYLLNYGLSLVSVTNGQLFLQAGGTGSSVWYQTNNIVAGKWYHFTLVRNDSVNTYYINGDLVFATASNNIGSTYNPNVHFIIGSGRALTSQNFNGKIDDITIYNRVLSASEINMLYGVK